MMERLKGYCFYIVGGFCLTGASAYLNSTFLETYLKGNLITLLIALLAINTTTSSVIMTKLREISDATKGNFESTINELRMSIYEQIGCILLTVLFLILSSSDAIVGFHASIAFILNVLVASAFVAGLYALCDTAKSIFVILRFENHKK